MPFTPPPTVPNFVPGTTARITLDRYDFEAHLEGTNPPLANAPAQNFRHTAPQIDLSPTLTFDGYGASTVQQALDLLASFVAAPEIPPATETSLGVIQLAGDLNGGNLAASPIVSGIRGRPIQNIAPTTGQALIYNGSSWTPATVSGAPTGAAGGGLSGTYPNPIVSKLNNVIISAATPSSGAVLTSTGSTNASWTTPSISFTSDLSGGGALTSAVPVLVAKIQGSPVSNAVPFTGNTLTYLGGIEWGPATFARGWNTVANTLTVPTSYSSASIMTTVGVTPAVTGNIRLTVSGSVQNTSGSSNILIVNFSHGAGNFSTFDYPSVCTVVVPAAGSDFGYAAISASVDLDSVHLPTPTTGSPFPVGTVVSFNVVCVALGSGLSFTSSSGYGSLQFTVQEVA